MKEQTQQDSYVQSTENVINDLKQALRIPVVRYRRGLLLAFYQHLIDNEPFPINSFSKEREVDRFLKANNCGQRAAAKQSGEFKKLNYD